VDVAGDALFVEGEVTEGSVVENKDLSLNYGVVDTGVFGFDFVAERAELAIGEHVFFDGFEAVETEVVVGYGLGELEFYFAYGVETLDVGFDEGVHGFAVFVGHDNGQAREAMLEAVHFADGFAFGCSGASALFGVGSVGGELFIGYRHCEIAPR
jgi:hypothetical protein